MKVKCLKVEYASGDTSYYNLDHSIYKDIFKINDRDEAINSMGFYVTIDEIDVDLITYLLYKLGIIDTSQLASKRRNNK